MKAMTRSIAAYVTLNEDAQNLPPFVEPVKIPNAKSAPAGRFVGVYGTQGTLLFFKDVRRRVPPGFTVRRVNILVDIGSSGKNMTTLTRLPDTFAVHLNFLSVDMQQYIKGIIPVHEPYTISQTIAYDPALLNMLWADVDLAHIRLFCWQHPTPANPQCQFGAVASPECISRIEVRNFYHPANPQLKFL